MGIMSVSVPDDLKKTMAEMDEINWSAVARNAFESKIEEIRLFKRLTEKSKLTPEDAREISKKLNENIAKKFNSR